MTIHQAVQILDIPKATIRFYEKEGLLQPARRENGYRDYSEGDILRLKRIVVLRKLGLPVEVISDLLDGVTTLPEALGPHISNLQKQAEELNGAIQLCRELQRGQAQIDDANAGQWWDRIHTEERAGLRFMDLARDYLEFQGEMWETQFAGRKAGASGPVNWKRTACLAAAALVLVVLIQTRLHTGLLESLLSIFAVLLLVAVIEIPIFLLRRKGGRGAGAYRKTMLAAAGIFLALVLVWTALMVLNGWLHFWW